MNFNVVVYSHSEYSDVLKIQTDYVLGFQNKFLLIDEKFNDEEILSKYDQIVRYDDNLPYSDRLLNISEINCEYILFIHDIDILINYSLDFLESCVSKMKEENIHRVDLQYYPKNSETKVTKLNHQDNVIELIKQENLNQFIYNVNPSIWKLDVFMNIMNKFKNRTYRDIESMDVQEYSSQFNIYKLHFENYLQVGYYNCINEFIFLHISHYGMFLPKENNDLPDNIQKIYENIIEKYLINSNKNFRTVKHG
jgi:hypothetical protein